MQKDKPHGLKEDSHATDQFDNAEYERWSASLQARKSTETRREIDAIPNKTAKP